MTQFESILFGPNAGDPSAGSVAPAHFVDLNLDQVIASVTAGREAYQLAELFHHPLTDLDLINFRLEVMRDLERPALRAAFNKFAQGLRLVHVHAGRAEKLYHPRQRDRWFLESVETYAGALERLAGDLEASWFRARGLADFRDYLSAYVRSEDFRSLIDEARSIDEALSRVQYTLTIRGLEVEVFPHELGADFSAEIEGMFDRFKDRGTKDYEFKFPSSADADTVESRLLDLVVKLYPDLFSRLEAFKTVNSGYFDARIARFERELQFYLGYLEHIENLKQTGLTFCYPEVGAAGRQVQSAGSFDLALAGKLAAEDQVPVTNDFHLNGPERIIVVSGPNQGGKTTFARTFGQLHYLASLGCPVPGSRAQLALYDRLLTHFERGENTADQRGKLQDDLLRVHEILERATCDSIVILNEIFTSTTLQDAIALSKKIYARLSELDLLCVWVTFVDELASMGGRTVSMVSTVEPDDPTRRTFKVVRQPADGRSYAMSIAEKYRLTLAQIRVRLAS